MTLARVVFIAGLFSTAACTSLLDIDGYEFRSSANGSGGKAAEGVASTTATGAASGDGGADQSAGGMAGSSNAMASSSSSGGTGPCTSGTDDCEVCLGQACCADYSACALDTSCSCFAECILVMNKSYNYCGMMCGGMPTEPLFSNLYGCSVIECNACGT